VLRWPTELETGETAAEWLAANVPVLTLHDEIARGRV
jgi:hypothetical protein